MDVPRPNQRSLPWQGLWTLLGTAAVLVAVSVIFSHWDLDRTITKQFYSSQSGWYLKNAQPWRWLYQYGTLPGIVLSLVALAGALVVWRRRPASLWPRYLMVVVLTSVIGAGILVNGILKPYWGRPRPSQIQDFGGQYVYRDALKPGIPGKGKSFTCGHCTMGFVFVALFYLRRKSPALGWSGLCFGLAYGGLLSAARVVQGAHFVTDCVWSLGIIWMVATILYYFVLDLPGAGDRIQKPVNRIRHRLITAAGMVLAIAMIMASLTRRPYFETYAFNYGSIQGRIRQMVVDKGDVVRTSIRYSDHGPLYILIHSQGFAWPGASEEPVPKGSWKDDGTYSARPRTEPSGYFSERVQELEVVIPRHLKDRIRVIFIDQGRERQ